MMKVESLPFLRIGFTAGGDLMEGASADIVPRVPASSAVRWVAESCSYGIAALEGIPRGKMGELCGLETEFRQWREMLRRLIDYLVKKFSC
jgi:hypothetical protein